MKTLSVNSVYLSTVSLAYNACICAPLAVLFSDV